MNTAKKLSHFALTGLSLDKHRMYLNSNHSVTLDSNNCVTIREWSLVLGILLLQHVQFAFHMQSRYAVLVLQIKNSANHYVTKLTSMLP